MWMPRWRVVGEAFPELSNVQDRSSPGEQMRTEPMNIPSLRYCFLGPGVGTRAKQRPFCAAYLTMPMHWVVRRHFDVTKRSSDDTIAAEAGQHLALVFALTPVS